MDENKKTRKSKPAVEDDTYGDAPWMGTLRHIKVEPKIVNTLKPQFKRYPDEDAPNPYSSTQGKRKIGDGMSLMSAWKPGLSLSRGLDMLKEPLSE